MKLNHWTLICFALVLIVHACVQPAQNFEKLPPGIWRAVLLLDRQPVQKYGDDRDIVKKFDSDAELPFNFEVIYINDDQFYIVIHNAEERIRIDNIQYGRDKATAKDTIIINFDVFDTQIRAIYEDGVMEGDWIVNYRDNYKIPFKAVFGQAHRFSNVTDVPSVDISGNWASKFEIGTEDEYPAIGSFKQDKNKLTGTFLTETGDYRYLEGYIKDSKFYLSCFDGAHAFLFLGKVMEDGTISGTFRSGSQYTTNWEATKNADAELTDVYNLTGFSSEDPLNFSFPNHAGKLVSINDPIYKDKVKLIQIMGTWCPNCMDETVFLQEYFDENPDEEVAIISLAFERYRSTDKSLEIISNFKNKMKLTNEVLLAGYYNKAEAAKSIPQLEKILSYPTLLFVDKQNRILKIHTGFNGPATAEYEKFKKEFTASLETLKKSAS